MPNQELTAVVRHALLPKVYVQVWKSAPLIAHWLSQEVTDAPGFFEADEGTDRQPRHS